MTQYVLLTDPVTMTTATWASPGPGVGSVPLLVQVQMLWMIYFDIQIYIIYKKRSDRIGDSMMRPKIYKINII